ncbi:hypothetical protein PHLCEN_2v5293 [Hermanssonia centrifuga]|uniref:BTB domain-containing protein n=1 Tax=Hermanssonia centrifuga TaxID=98765 RepID=A0A2R6P922_9APHY|nr:hypothetical protein PHLCEN_2v5293 [Hermanssonia centrifuga]
MSPPTLSTARSPFDNAKADTILQTSDNVQFHVRSAILSEASLVFCGMFSLPEPTNPPETPVITVTEDSRTMDALLRLCYPVCDPVFTDLSLLEYVWEAARKYGFDYAAEKAGRAVKTFLGTSPLRVFAISCRLGVEDVAGLAAIAWKNSDTFKSLSSLQTPRKFEGTLAGGSYVTEMKNISSEAYYRLLSFLRTNPNPQNPRFCGTSVSLTVRQNSQRVHPTFDVPSRADADCVIRASDGAEFFVHKLMIRSASAEALLAGEGSLDLRVDDLPIVEVEIQSDILVELLKLCYPTNTLSVDDCAKIRRMLQAASSYKMARIVDIIRKRVMDLLDMHPLPLFFIAIEQSWEDVAEAAAKRIATGAIKDLYTPEMKDVSAAAHFCLLKYCHQYSVIVSDAVSRYSTDAKLWKQLEFALDSALLISDSIVHVPLPIVESSLSSRNGSSIHEVVAKSEAMASRMKRDMSQVNVQDTASD